MKRLLHRWSDFWNGCDFHEKALFVFTILAFVGGLAIFYIKLFAPELQP